MMIENEISYQIRGAIFEVYRQLGPGLLESIYHAALHHELKKRGLKVLSEVPIEVKYDGIVLPVYYRLDLLVEDKVIVEIKSVEELTKLHHKQVLTYLKIADKRLGLLVNFNTDDIAKTIHRKVNNL